MESNVVKFLFGYNKFKELIKSFNEKKQAKIIRPFDSGFSHLISSFISKSSNDFLIISDKDIFILKKQISSFLNLYNKETDVLLLPSSYNSPYLIKDTPLFISYERIRAFISILKKDRKKVIITDPNSLLFPLPPLSAIKEYSLKIETGEEISQEFLIKKLRQFSYSERDLTIYQGDFSVRGHIIDIFPLGESFPIRIDFDGDEIFSIRHFDPSTQRTIKKIEKAQILTIAEFLTKKEKEDLKPILKKKWDNSLTSNILKRLFKYWSEGLYFQGEEIFRVFLNNEDSLLIEQEKIFIKDIENYEDYIKQLKEDWQKHREKNISFFLSPPLNLFFKKNIPFAKTFNSLEFSHIPEKNAFYFPYRKLNFNENSFSETVEKSKNEIFLIFTKDEKIKEKIIKEIDEKNFTKIYFVKDEIEDGFSFVLSEGVNINFVHFFKKAKERKIEKKAASFHFQLGFKEGDFVVHTKYGIALFKGIKKLKIKDNYSEFLVLEYSGGDKVYVAIEDFNLVYRYSGPEGYIPVLDKLGSKNWTRTREKVKSGIFKIARDLLKLYAKRKSLKASPLYPDEEKEALFISNFEFEETEDQKRSWEEISYDLKQEQPMDRLLCGDVGFGKTEIAMRAAFRAVSNKKQVALLCPTTILAEQHFRNFKKRFSGFPYKIEELSRMTTPAKKKKIYEKIEKGEIDIIVGTHALLSDKIKFKNLALLIIDEEQRFGVKHKDKILKMKENIHVLSLSATPIPRTLNMALSGVKDLSIIETPPPGRMEIATIVEEYNEEIIKEAIKFEIARDGQVYIIYNNIERIESFGNLIKRLIPSIENTIIHSKLPNRTIEERMLNFINKKTKILISTTIIENGIDIENVNTLIVIDAQNFGLSQLYQLRGRIGRGNRKAYAYFLINSKHLLNEKAKKRLKAIREFQELGSGFRLAAMDLEIRGAGNLLGKEQHGHLRAVGFEYYLWLLNKTIKEMKGEEEYEVSPEINLPLTYIIPEAYIPQSSQRLALYKRFSSIKNLSELKELEEELFDRFGNLPLEIKNLIFVVMLRIYSLRLRIIKMDYKYEKLTIEFSPLSKISEKRIIETLRKYKGESLEDLRISFSFTSIEKLKRTLPLILKDLSTN